MAEVVVKWCPKMPRTHAPVNTAYASSTNPYETQTTFSNCIENLCTAYKDGECKMFNTSVYLPVEHRE